MFIKCFFMKTLVLTFILISINFLIYSHEEPSKTLNEKKEKQERQKQIIQAKIKTSTAWKYVFANEKETEVKNKVFVMGYDNKGNMSYIEAYKNDSLQERDEISYNEKGDMISQIDFSADMKIMEKDFFYFDNDGRVFSGGTKNSNDSIMETFKIVHGKNHLDLQFEKYKSSGQKVYWFTYKYDQDFDKSDFVEAIRYDSLGKVVMKAEKKYNEKGKQIEKIIFDGDLKVSYSFIYEYDTKGNNTAITKKQANGTIVWKDYYGYDNYGNCKEIKSYDINTTLTSHIQYSFEYYK